MINVLTAWTSPWLIVGFCRHGQGGWGWGELKWHCWHCPLLPSWAWEGQGCDPQHPQIVQRAGTDSDWSELYSCQGTSSHQRMKSHFQRVCGHTHSHQGNVHMDCIPSRALFTGNPCSGLLLTNVTQSKSAQGALLRWLGWVSAASRFHSALLPWKKRQDALSHGAFHCGTKPSLRGTMQFKCFMAIMLCLS